MRIHFTPFRKPLSSLLLMLMLAFGAPIVLPALSGVTHAATQATYIVQRGDTLYAIARRFGTTVQALKSVNGLTSDTIYVGQRLIIPGTTDAPATTSYVVQRGDTLYSIARRYFTTTANLMLLNNLRGTTIYAGQTMRVPIGAFTTTPAPAQRVQFARGATGTVIEGSTYYIQPYLLWAAAGQEMMVNVATWQENAYITVLDPQGVNIAGSDGPIKSFNGRLPATGDYTVQIISPSRVLIDYNITFNIVTR